MQRIGPYSRPHVLAMMDGRSREAKLLNSVREDLTAHVGGRPTATQRVLIERAAWLTLHLAMMDAKAIEAGVVLTERESKSYLGWHNSLTRTVRQIGLRGAPAERPSLDIYLGKPAG